MIWDILTLTAIQEKAIPIALRKKRYYRVAKVEQEKFAFYFYFRDLIKEKNSEKKKKTNK